ncbi:small ribosomal subunit protein mS31-like [Branchiostoma floridae x Branchiostoma japonicum]
MERWIPDWWQQLKTWPPVWGEGRGSDGEVDPRLVAAAKDVASSLGGGERVESALQQQLTLVTFVLMCAAVMERWTPDWWQQLKTWPPVWGEGRGSDGEVDPRLVAAAKDVASSLGGGERVESALLQQLRRHEDTTSAAKSAATPAETSADNNSLGDLISGLRVVQGQKTNRNATRGNRSEVKNFRQEFQQTRQSQPRSEQVFRKERRSLFEGKRLGIFMQEEVNSWEPDAPTLWDEEQKAELEAQVDCPPRNGFEEMIQWTKEGKMWTFPIQNDQGLEEEAAVGFHEHVFLEDLLEGFPEKGPIRHFMELVVTGLSKNPYLTLQQKREHVDWFQNYFQETEPILRASGSLTA